MSHLNLIMNVCQVSFDNAAQKRRVKTSNIPIPSIYDKNDLIREEVNRTDQLKGRIVKGNSFIPKTNIRNQIHFDKVKKYSKPIVPAALNYSSNPTHN